MSVFNRRQGSLPASREMKSKALKKTLEILSPAADSASINSKVGMFYRTSDGFAKPTSVEKSAFQKGNASDAKPVQTMAESQRWKEFNNYETKDHQFRTKEALKQEINNIYYRIALARDAQLTNKKMATVDVDPSSTLASWKVPDIEQSARFFDEKARFYDTSKDMRRYGKKHVPPPIAENLQQLFEEKL